MFSTWFTGWRFKVLLAGWPASGQAGVEAAPSTWHAEGGLCLDCVVLHLLCGSAATDYVFVRTLRTEYALCSVVQTFNAAASRVGPGVKHVECMARRPSVRSRVLPPQPPNQVFFIHLLHNLPPPPYLYSSSCGGATKHFCFTRLHVPHVGDHLF